MMSGLEVVAMTSSRRPFGGTLASSTSSVCSASFEKRGPIGTYSSSRSRSSSTTIEFGDLYAWSNAASIRSQRLDSE